MSDNIGLSIQYGLPPWRTNVDHAVTNRFNRIKSQLRQKDGEVLYGLNRTNPESLAWRMLQNNNFLFVRKFFQVKWYLRPLYWISETTMPIRVWLGMYDTEIELAWHDGARAEYWYSFEKNWE